MRSNGLRLLTRKHTVPEGRRYNVTRVLLDIYPTFPGDRTELSLSESERFQTSLRAKPFSLLGAARKLPINQMFSSSFSLLAWSYEGATGKRFFFTF